MTRFNRMTAVASLSLLAFSVLPATANGIGISGQGLTPTEMLIVTGAIGGNHTDPAMRACSGSTACRESGSFYTDHGILNYKNTASSREPKLERHTGKKQFHNPYSLYNRN